jgi:hypothetical protein
MLQTLYLGRVQDVQASSALFGGIPRAVGSGSGWNFCKQKLDRALGSLHFRSILLKLMNGASPSSIPSDMSDALLHTLPPKSDCQEPSCQWASPKIFQMVALKLLEDVNTELLGHMASAQPGGVVGVLAEKLWFEMFVRSAHVNYLVNLEVRTANKKSPAMDSDAAALRAFSSCEQRWFWADDMPAAFLQAIKDVQAGSAILMMPHEDNLPAIDGVMVILVNHKPMVLLLQATISRTHPTSEGAGSWTRSSKC